MTNNELTFVHLVDSIRQIHKQCESQSGRAVNISLTLRNWMIGFYIAEFELHGEDRAKYGDKLFSILGEHLTSLRISNCNRRQLYRYLRFYQLYPTIVRTLSPQLRKLLPAGSGSTRKVGTLSPQFQIPPDKLVNQLSYSQLELIVDLDDEIIRGFYTIECMHGNWSVRELKRQIASLYYERSGLSRNKEKLAELVRTGAEPAEPELSIHDPYIFEFLGLKPQEVMSESDLENHLLDKLQEFLLEMGHGFCFEARQKRILIGDTHNFVDLVFYHRILKCHVLVELKVDKFTHEHIGQLNTYVSWYKKNEMTAGDNPPIGILLCTQKDETLVEYALSGMANQMFVSKYQLELPKKEEMERFLAKQMRDLDAGSKGSVVD